MPTTDKIHPLHLLAAITASTMRARTQARLRDYTMHAISTRVQSDCWLEDAGLIDVSGEPTALGQLVNDYYPRNPQGLGWTTPTVTTTISHDSLLRDVLLRLHCWRAVRLGRWCMLPVMAWDTLPLDRLTWALRRHPDDGDGARVLPWDTLPKVALVTWDGVLLQGAGDNLIDRAARALIDRWRTDW